MEVKERDWHMKEEMDKYDWCTKVEKCDRMISKVRQKSEWGCQIKWTDEIGKIEE